MKIVFLGTPDFTIPSLEKLYHSEHKLVAIVSQPDKPNERGNKIVYSPVKLFAEKHGIELFQFEKISRDGLETLREIAPDIMITASYGQILSQEIIDIPKYGVINVHASLLPKYRGASPIQTAILKGEEKTGITIMQTEAGLDTGDIILQRETEIGEEETAGELTDRLATIGAEALMEVLELIKNGVVEHRKQSHVEATVTTKITKEQGKLFWVKNAEQLRDHIHAFNPTPVAFTFLNHERIKIYRARIRKDIESTDLLPGTILKVSSAKNGLFVQCGVGVLEILELQFVSGKVITGKEAINGRKVKPDDCFSVEEKIDSTPIILKKKNKENL